jgi:hypothetical protein
MHFSPNLNSTHPLTHQRPHPWFCHGQGIVISMINSWGKIRDPEDGKALQNLMICAEMLLAGTSMLYAFPYKEYQIGGSTAGWRWSAFSHAISIKDVVKDVVHVVSMTNDMYAVWRHDMLCSFGWPCMGPASYQLPLYRIPCW